MSESAIEPPQSPPRASLPKSLPREYLETIVVCVMILIFARTFVFMQSKIPTESMKDTLLVGDYILVNRYQYGAKGDLGFPWLGQREIRRHDVIVFRFPENPDVDYVKRVIGLPGDEVRMNQGMIFINGKPLDEPYVIPAHRRLSSHMNPVIVPEDSYFALGDNRDNSRDSRAWGFVPRSMIKGRAFFIWYSYEEDPNDHLNVGTRRIVSILKKARYFFERTRRDRIFSWIE